MAVVIEPAQLSDAEGIVSLASEIVAYYKANDVTTDLDPLTVRNILFDGNIGTYALVAREDSSVVGIASYSFIWPAAGGRRAIFLKDLFVTELHRGSGVGSQLIEALKNIGREHDCARIDWTVDSSNSDVTEFYERIGGFESDKIGYRLLL